MDKAEKSQKGRLSRQRGNNFETRVREDQEARGHVVDKWTNNVNIEQDKLVPVKAKWIAGRMVMNKGGFPDFICYSPREHNVFGVESKMSGDLDKEEREKARWLLDKKIFSKILIAEKIIGSGRIKILYHDFEEKYGNV